MTLSSHIVVALVVFSRHSIQPDAVTQVICLTLGGIRTGDLDLILIHSLLI